MNVEKKVGTVIKGVNSRSGDGLVMTEEGIKEEGPPSLTTTSFVLFCFETEDNYFFGPKLFRPPKQQSKDGRERQFAREGTFASITQSSSLAKSKRVCWLVL